MRPYQAFGTGRGLDANGRYIGVVLVHSNEELARENAALLRQRIEETLNLAHSKPWRETVDLESMEIRAEGRLLLPAPAAQVGIEAQVHLEGFYRIWESSSQDAVSPDRSPGRRPLQEKHRGIRRLA